jgi:nucleoside-diphosphate-sugar epimerase
MKLVRAAAAADVQNFLIAGSYFEYGPPPRGSDFIETTTRLAPTQAYPISKAAASIVFEGFAREYSLKLKILRIFQVFGEGEHPNRMWPSMRRAALAGEDFPMSAGGQLRDFVRVEDVASQFVRHLDFSNVVPGMPEVLHAASGEAKTLLDFARHWWQVWGATGQLLPGRVPYRKNELFRLIPAPGSLA